MLKRDKRKIILTITLMTAMLISIVGTYAYFIGRINNDKAQIAGLKTGTMSLTFEDNDAGINEKLSFGESIVKKFKIINMGTLESSLSLDFDQMINTYLNGSLTYNLSSSNEEGGEYKEIIPETNMPVSSAPLTQTLAQELSVPAGDTYYYNLTITLNVTDFDQTDDKGAVYSTKFSVGEPVRYRYYSLIVDPDGGTWGDFTSPQEYYLKNRETLEINEIPVKTGSTFLGWKLVGVSSSYDNNTFTMGISDAKLIAEWDANKYNLAVDLNGGSYDEELPTEIKYGESLELKNPTREGHEFAGWSTEAGSINDNRFTMTSARDALITANWTAKKYEYKIIHRQMNIDGNGYKEIDTETGFLAYDTRLNAPVKTYEGFTSPSVKEITIKTTGNTVTYDYARNRYTLTIDPDGGIYTGNTTTTMYYGSTTTVPNPTKEGYTFSGWEVSKGILAETTYTCGAGEAKLTAQWVPNTYKYIVYHDKMNLDGSTYTTADTTPGEGKYGSNVTPSTNSYTGFTSPPKKTLRIGIENNNPPTNNRLTYQYARNRYTLTIDLKGGTYSETNPGEMYYGESITLGTPTKKNYSFTGWTKTEGADSTFSGNTFTMGSTSSNLQAGWTVKTCNYIVKHMQENTNDSNYTTVSTQELSADCGTAQTPATNTYTGFGSTATEAVNLEEEMTPVVEYKYNRNTYTLTINPNGGSYNGTSSNINQTLKYGETITLSAPTKTGYTYTWNKTSGTDSTLSGSTFTMGTSAASVTANWTAKTYTVTFNANGGSTSTSSKTVKYASTYGTLPTPTYTGYKFMGWFTAKSGGTQVTSSSIVSITGNQTLFAQWKLAVGTSATLEALKITPKTGSPTFANAATTDEGVYSMADDYGTSYYYRGAVTNNYVKFGGFYWRIIRINGDGSVRMTYDGTQAWPNGDNSSDRFISKTATKLTPYSDAMFVGWMFGESSPSTQKNGALSTSATHNQTDSNIKTQVDEWYKANIEDKSLSKYISDTIFCNDRSTPGSTATGLSSDTGLGYGKNTTAYGAYARTGVEVSTVQPQFKCPEKNDAFTVSDTAKGNGALTYPVGLITADEVVAAGSGKYNTTNHNYYLYRNNKYWSFSPKSFFKSKMGNITRYLSHIFIVDAGGSLSTNEYINGSSQISNPGALIAPVINLSAKYAANMTGSGTTTAPYQIPGVE